MTTRDELIGGIRMLIQEAQRTTARFKPDDWTYQVHDEGGGWTAKQLYCHLASTAEITPGFVSAMSQAAEGQNLAANLDIDAFNTQGVTKYAAMGSAELVGAVKTQYEKLIEFVKAMPDDQLQQKRRFGAMEGPVVDIMQTALVLHGISHIYNAQSRPLN